MFKKFLPLAVALILLLAPAGANAFSVTPVKYNLSVDPGKTATLSLTLSNNQNSAAVYKFYTVAVRPDSQGRPIFSDVTDEAVDWVKPDNNLLNFKPQENKTVFFTVKVPSTASPGLHYVALISEIYSKSNSSVGISSRAATLVSLTVAGQIIESLSIEKWQASPVFFKPTASLNLLLKNNSPISLPVAGEISVYNWLGKKVASGPITLGNNIFPQSFRQLSLPVPLDVYLPGSYQAQINIVYGLSKSNASAIVTIWYLPWWSVLAVILLFSLFIIRAIFKKKN